MISLKNKRTNRNNFRLSDQEQIDFLQKIKSAGINRSAFIRKCLISAKVIAKFTTEEKGYYRTMIGMATNLNQLAKRANETKDFSTVAIDLKITALNINNLIEKFNKK